MPTRKPRAPKNAIVPTAGDELKELRARQRALAVANKKVTVGIRMPYELWKSLIETAERTRAESFTWLVVRALQEWVTTNNQTNYDFFPGAVVTGSLRAAGEMADPMKPVQARYAGENRLAREMRAAALQRQADEQDVEFQTAMRRSRQADDLLSAPLPSHAPLPDQSDSPDLPALTAEELAFMQAQGISPRDVEPPPPNA